MFSINLETFFHFLLFQCKVGRLVDRMPLLNEIKNQEFENVVSLKVQRESRRPVTWNNKNNKSRTAFGRTKSCTVITRN
jgi:hypothetical protein